MVRDCQAFSKSNFKKSIKSRKLREQTVKKKVQKHPSMKTPSSSNCTLLKFNKFLFFFSKKKRKNRHGNLTLVRPRCCRLQSQWRVCSLGVWEAFQFADPSLKLDFLHCLSLFLDTWSYTSPLLSPPLRFSPSPCWFLERVSGAASERDCLTYDPTGVNKEASPIECCTRALSASILHRPGWGRDQERPITV